MQSTRLLTTLACAALAAFSHPAAAASSDLDLTFGGTGKVTTAFGSGVNGGNSIVIQGDGKIVVAGTSYNGSNYDFALVRYNTNGSLDTTFNGTGKVTTAIGSGTDFGSSVAIQEDGKIVVAGTSDNGSNYDFAVARYNVNGSLDLSFNGTGKVTTAIGSGFDAGSSVATQSDGKIVVAGSARIGSTDDFAVVRYNSNGSLDTSFNGNGKVTTPIGIGNDGVACMAVQGDGKIVAAGYSYPSTVTTTSSHFAVVRYNTNGSLDTSFNGTGKVVTAFGSVYDSAHSVAIQNDGKIVAAGVTNNGTNNDCALVRYNTNGSLDISFNSTGKVVTAFQNGDDYANGVLVQGDGRIVIAGESDDQGKGFFAVARYNTDGSLDTTFSATGKVTTAFGSAASSGGTSVALQSDRKIVVAGSSGTGSSNDFAVVRYKGDLDTDGDGVLDDYETGTGIYVSPTDTGTSPTNPDTDGDGLNDGAEMNTYHSNPHIKDTDGDGFEDGFEVSTGFSPTSAASTPDALSSIRTAAEYRFNAAPGISYRIEASTDFTNWTTIETNLIGTGGVITRFYSIEGQPRRFFRSRRN